MFTDALVMGAPRLDMAANDVVQRGAYVAGKPANHMGKILYPECKKVRAGRDGAGSGVRCSGSERGGGKAVNRADRIAADGRWGRRAGPEARKWSMHDGAQLQASTGVQAELEVYSRVLAQGCS